MGSIFSSNDEADFRYEEKKLAKRVATFTNSGGLQASSEIQTRLLDSCLKSLRTDELVNGTVIGIWDTATRDVWCSTVVVK